MADPTITESGLQPNQGHGHVTPRPDGVKARCGGPSFCEVCQRERAALSAPSQAAEHAQLLTERDNWKRWCKEAEATAAGNALSWAVDRWIDEVKYRPLVNVHRRTLDDTWRQVMRHFGGDPEQLVGPSHDALMSASAASAPAPAALLREPLSDTGVELLRAAQQALVCMRGLQQHLGSAVCEAEVANLAAAIANAAGSNT